MNSTTLAKDDSVPRVTLPVDLRDYFAAKALQGLLASPGSDRWFGRVPFSNVLSDDNFVKDARYCYSVADAMLKARDAGERP